jgi:transcriptional regulator with GAF, ATPase, and Fis domain
MAIDVAHMFRREQLSDEALLAIGAHGTLTTPVDKDPTHLANLLCKELGQETLSLADLEQRLLQDALSAAGGNVAKAARSLGLTRAQLAYRLQRVA